MIGTMGITQLTEQFVLDHTPAHVRVQFNCPHQVLSSAVLNGGLVRAEHIVNLKVPKNTGADRENLEPPDITLTRYCRNAGWPGTAVGMMTAASMDSLCTARKNKQGVDTVVLVTSGLSNPKRAGDRAEHRVMGQPPADTGTINIIVLVSTALTRSAMVESVMLTTEAKAAALQALGIKSPISNDTATGTDAIAIVSGHGPVEISCCGKHAVFGEVLARLVIEAVTASVSWDLRESNHA